MTLFEYILLGVCLVCIAGPTLWMMLTPPRRSAYHAPSPLELDRWLRNQRVKRALQRFTTDHEGRERIGI